MTRYFYMDPIYGWMLKLKLKGTVTFYFVKFFISLMSIRFLSRKAPSNIKLIDIKSFQQILEAFIPFQNELLTKKNSYCI